MGVSTPPLAGNLTGFTVGMGIRRKPPPAIPTQASRDIVRNL